MATWTAELRGSMLAANWLRETAPARTVLCDACDDGHWEEPVEVDDSFDFIACPSSGRVAVASERRRRWSIETDGIARWCARQLGLRGGPEALVAGKLWGLGRYLAGGAGWSVFVFVYGRPTECVAAEDKMASYNQPLVLSLGTQVAELKVPTIGLQDVLAFDASAGLAIDRATLEERCAPFTHVVPEAHPGAAGDTWRLSADFRTARSSDDRLDLTPSQARAVEIFHRQLLLGDEELSQHYVLEQAEVDSKTLYQVFRRSRAWGRLIVAGSARGMFRLDVESPQIHR